MDNKRRVLVMIATVVVVLLIDQIVKIYIKTHLSYGTGFGIFGLEWARIHFVENEGMAFGITFGNKCIGISTDGHCKGIVLTPERAKLLLSSFRIVMIGFLIYLIRELHKAAEPLGLVFSFCLILAGAIGNMIDSAIYGIIFSASNIHEGNVAELFPDGGGYAPFLHGKVVDMFYFPMFEGILPDWIPFFGGKYFEFFRHIFNVADASISIGVVIVILFYRKKLFNDPKKTVQEPHIYKAE